MSQVTLDISFGPVQLNLVVGFVFLVGGAVFPFALAALFGRWYLRSPVAAFILVSAVTFWLVAQVCGFLGQTFQVPDPALFWLFVDALVFGLVFLVLDSIVGLQRPHLERRRPASVALVAPRPAADLAQEPHRREHPDVRGLEHRSLRTPRRSPSAGTPIARFRGLVDRLSGTVVQEPGQAVDAREGPGHAPAARPDVREARPDDRAGARSCYRPAGARSSPSSRAPSRPSRGRWRRPS